MPRQQAAMPRPEISSKKKSVQLRGAHVPGVLCCVMGPVSAKRKARTQVWRGPQSLLVSTWSPPSFKIVPSRYRRRTAATRV
ncbi:hypothetical protein PAXRUDRAFT_462947 [Paxillus rubicundulus Ve08.2h10]|uniref:Uncharacterized protein n=1 Tax=Paxillus rubicundulus Ve08.2h10 TaxID=930991 RepID=A0A0D0EB14_9AGAM|nr:hypothetical protein PAXRUDRAFT_462947 [Paxillus rubicundulus Ve08.2h10]